MPVADAVAMIHATTTEERSRFVREIWNIRKGRHGAAGREEVPF
jgi:hypothetical protein